MEELLKGTWSLEECLKFNYIRMKLMEAEDVVQANSQDSIKQINIRSNTGLPR